MKSRSRICAAELAGHEVRPQTRQEGLWLAFGPGAVELCQCRGFLPPETRFAVPEVVYLTVSSEGETHDYLLGSPSMGKQNLNVMQKEKGRRLPISRGLVPDSAPD